MRPTPLFWIPQCILVLTFLLGAFSPLPASAETKSYEALSRLFDQLSRAADPAEASKLLVEAFGEDVRDETGRMVTRLGWQRVLQLPDGILQKVMGIVPGSALGFKGEKEGFAFDRDQTLSEPDKTRLRTAAWNSQLEQVAQKHDELREILGRERSARSRLNDDQEPALSWVYRFRWPWVAVSALAATAALIWSDHRVEISAFLAFANIVPGWFIYEDGLKRWRQREFRTNLNRFETLKDYAVAHKLPLSSAARAMIDRARHGSRTLPRLVDNTEDVEFNERMAAQEAMQSTAEEAPGLAITVKELRQPAPKPGEEPKALRPMLERGNGGESDTLFLPKGHSFFNRLNDWYLAPANLGRTLGEGIWVRFPDLDPNRCYFYSWSEGKITINAGSARIQFSSSPFDWDDSSAHTTIGSGRISVAKLREMLPREGLCRRLWNRLWAKRR